MTTNAPEQFRTTTTPAELAANSPSRLRQAASTVRTSRPVQAVSTHRKPVSAGLLAVVGAATAALFVLRKRNAKPAPSGWRAVLRRR